MDADESVVMAEAFAVLAPAVRRRDEAFAALGRIAELVVAYVPGCDYAALGRCRQNLTTLAVSGTSAAQAEAVQIAAAEGPGLSAVEDRTSLAVPDVASDPRWPTYSRQLLASSTISSVLVLHLAGPDNSILTLFSNHPGAFPDEAVRTAEIVAGQVSMLAAIHELQDTATNLQTAVDSNRDIGAAVGIVMATYRLTHDAAYEFLRSVSQAQHRKLRDIAQAIVFTGEVPQPTHTYERMVHG